jgi:hypothetical protein
MYHVSAIHSKSDDKAAAFTDFITKYGKARICKYFEAEWDKQSKKGGEKRMDDMNEEVQKSCNDDKQGDKEFIRLMVGLINKATASASTSTTPSSSG